MKKVVKVKLPKVRKPVSTKPNKAMKSKKDYKRKNKSWFGGYEDGY